MCGSAGNLEDGVEEFAAEFVGNPEYSPRWPREPKIIHDALWGTIRLYPWEVAILDLPLFQRLRQIRQTSLVNYVFPGCSHSRFEHTLGVVHQTQRLADAVNAQDSAGPGPFDHNRIRDLRLAALFHDCGHGAFSHISEDVFQHLPDISAATAEGGPYSSANAHEVLSALILISQPVRDYLTQIADHYKVEFQPDRAAQWILGRPEDGNNEFLYVAQVVNGPYDADKLDYLFRDAHYSGLPLALDLDRLWASCEVGTLESGGKRARILTLHREATPLEQILFNKVNLFSVVYQHPKVRAAECMFRGVVEHVHENGLELAGRKLGLATDFLWVTDDRLFAAALELPARDPLHQMIHAMLYRRHFVRALTISKGTIDLEGNEAGYHELRKLNHRRDWTCHQERRRLARAIWEAAGRPHTPQHIWLDLPPDPPIGEADRTFVRMPSGELRKMTDFFPLQYWASLYVNHKWRGHVFCPADCQARVHEAAKSVFRDEFGLGFNALAKELSHVP